MKKAVSHFQNAVAKDDVNAIYNLAVLLRNGFENVQADLDDAVALLQEGVDIKSHFRCMIALADLCFDGYGHVNGDRQHAAGFIEQGIEMDDLDSMNLCTVLQQHGYDEDGYDSDDSEVSFQRGYVFRSAIEHGGQPIAMYSIGCLVRNGHLDVSGDKTAAARWFQRGIDYGDDSLAMVALAKLYLRGFANTGADVKRVLRLL